MIPAGNYLASDYSAKLNELDWSLIFSEELDGVAFFQLFLKRIKDELAPDVLIIDSRTGFSEIGGLCTQQQQLADETVIISSLASESIKMTRRLAELIRSSRVSQSLGKEVETKVVVSRVPKPREIEKLKTECCKKFEVAESKLFFLFSCPNLERQEFVAMLDTEREEGLVASYVQLFQGLDVKVAQDSINEEIERAEKGLLSCSPSEAESRIREMVALYPHPEVYRRAMRFFKLTRRNEDAAVFGVKLLELLPEDDEAISQVANFVLQSEQAFRRGMRGHSFQKLNEIADIERLMSIAKQAHEKKLLSIGDAIRLADMLEDLDEDAIAFEIAMQCLDSEEIEDPKSRLMALEIATRTAYATGRKDVATELISSVPPSRLSGTLASITVNLKAESESPNDAFELAKMMLSREPDYILLGTAMELAQKLGRQSDLEGFIRITAEENDWDEEMIWHVQRHGIEMSKSIPRGRAIARARRARHRELEE